MSTNTNNKLTDETLSAWKTEAKISLGETARDSVEYSHHEAILALVTEIQEHRKAAAEPVLYVMGMGCAFDAETASTCKGAVDSWVGEWNQERLPGQEEYRTVPLYTAPPVQETGVYKDMLNIIGLLEKNEWAEHCTSTVLGSLLESEITRLVSKEQPAPVVPEEIPKGLAGQIVSLLAHNIGDKFLAQKIWNACRAAMLQGVEQPQNARQNIPENIPDGNSPVIQDGYVLVPKKLTAENGAKSVLSGEFSETKFINCPECFGDDDCETCDGSGRIEITVPVTWTTIKAIWAKGVEHFAAAPQQEVKSALEHGMQRYAGAMQKLAEGDE